MTTDPETTLVGAVKRAELAGRIARSLLMFPLYPQPGDTNEQHAAALEVSYTLEIVKHLNEASVQS